MAHRFVFRRPLHRCDQRWDSGTSIRIPQPQVTEQSLLPGIEKQCAASEGIGSKVVPLRLFPELPNKLMPAFCRKDVASATPAWLSNSSDRFFRQKASFGNPVVFHIVGRDSFYTGVTLLSASFALAQSRRRVRSNSQTIWIYSQWWHNGRLPDGDVGIAIATIPK